MLGVIIDLLGCNRFLWLCVMNAVTIVVERLYMEARCEGLALIWGEQCLLLLIVYPLFIACKGAVFMHCNVSMTTCLLHHKLMCE